MAPGREKRRSSGLIRVPFVRRCRIDLDDGTTRETFLVNVNILGAFIADDDPPLLGRGVCCQFRVPGTENVVAVDGIVAWINARQQHPVHSLPRGFGVEFRGISPQNREVLRGIVSDWMSRRRSSR